MSWSCPTELERGDLCTRGHLPRLLQGWFVHQPPDIVLDKLFKASLADGEGNVLEGLQKLGAQQLQERERPRPQGSAASFKAVPSKHPALASPQQSIHGPGEAVGEGGRNLARVPIPCACLPATRSGKGLQRMFAPEAGAVIAQENLLPAKGAPTFIL